MSTWLDRGLFGTALRFLSRGSAVSSRPSVNFASPLLATDNSGANRTDVTIDGIPSSGPGAGTNNAIPMVNAAGTTLSRTGVTSDGAGSLTLGTDGAADTSIKLFTDTAGIASYISHYTHIDAGSPPYGANQLVALATNRDIKAGVGVIDAAKPSGAYIIENQFYDGATTKVEIYGEAWDPVGAYFRRHGWSWDVANHSGSWFVHASSSTWLANDATTQIAAMSGAHFSIGATTSTTDSLLITQTAKTSGVPAAVRITDAAHTGITASTACADVMIDGTATKTWATGALATLQADVLIQHRTYAAAGASTFTKAATLAIDAGPAAGANMTITTSLGLYCGGKAEFADLVDLTTTSGFRIRSGTSYGAVFSAYAADTMQIAAYGTMSGLRLGDHFVISGFAGLDAKLTVSAGYGANGTYPWLDVTNPWDATNVLEQFTATEIWRGHTWSGGANTAFYFRQQCTSVTGSPSTIFYDVWSKLGAGAELKVMHIPGQTVTITGMTLAQLITQLTVNFPFFV